MATGLAHDPAFCRCRDFDLFCFFHSACRRCAIGSGFRVRQPMFPLAGISRRSLRRKAVAGRTTAARATARTGAGGFRSLHEGHAKSLRAMRLPRKHPSGCAEWSLPRRYPTNAQGRRKKHRLRRRHDRQRRLRLPARNRHALAAMADSFEAELFNAADKLRGNMEPSDYKHVALGLISSSTSPTASRLSGRNSWTDDGRTKPNVQRQHL